MTDLTPRRQDRLAARLGWAVFGLSLLFLLYLAPAHAVPGRGAAIAATFSGLDYFQPSTRPIWSALVAAVGALPIASVGHALNVLTALIGAAVCLLVYEFVRSIPFKRPRKNMLGAYENGARIAAGLTAAGFALAAPQLMLVASRGDHATLDALLLLLPFLIILRFAGAASSARFSASMLIFGLCAVENPTTLFVAPFFVFWWLIMLAQSNRLHTGAAIGYASPALIGPLLLLLFWRLLLSTEGSALRGFDSVWDVARDYLRIYKQELLHGVPRLGWFLILALNLLPFLIVMLRKLDEPRDVFSTLGSYAFRIVLFGVAMMTLLNLPGAPQRVIGLQTILLTPAIVTAIWFGFLVGYQTLAWMNDGHRIAVGALWIACAGAIGVAGVRHARETRAGDLRAVVDFAARIIHDMKERSTLVTDGQLDASLLLAAREAGKPLRIFNLQATPVREYSRAYAAALDLSLDEPTRSIPHPALLNRALERNPALADTLAVLTNPDAVRAPDRVALPSGAIYTFFLTTEPPEPSAIAGQIDTLPLPPAAHQQEGPEGFRQRWLSRLANDTGVYWDDARLTTNAAAYYRRALAYWPDNASAAINLIAHAGTERNAAIAELGALLRRLPDARAPAFRSQFSGRVRDPIARAGDAFQMLEEDPLEKALARAAAETRKPEARPRSNASPLLPEQRKEMEARLADLLGAARAAARDGDWLTANLHLNRALELSALRPDVLAIAGRLYLLQSDFHMAMRCWNILQLQFPDAAPIQALRGATWMFAGDYDRAEELLQDAIAEAPSDFAARFYLAALRIRQERPDEAREVFGVPPLSELLRSIESLIEERVLLARLLGDPGFDRLVQIVTAAHTTVTESLPALREQLRVAIAAMARGEWLPANRAFSEVVNRGARSPTVAYHLALTQYRHEPSDASLQRVESVILNYPGADTFTRAFAYLCLEAGDLARADRMIKRLNESDETLLMRTALLAARAEMAAAWTLLSQIPAGRRTALAPWFDAELPPIRALRQDARFESWLNEVKTK